MYSSYIFSIYFNTWVEISNSRSTKIHLWQVSYITVSMSHCIKISITLLISFGNETRTALCSLLGINIFLYYYFLFIYVCVRWGMLCFLSSHDGKIRQNLSFFFLCIVIVISRLAKWLKQGMSNLRMIRWTKPGYPNWTQ